ncbi:hypothetical protein [Bacillus sp. USDA818B3_A]|uniref:hypothetical protein n=1 Tax=Bacillus sp. USDA818B3_A TaxID=2698834 RepID=UPI00136E710F|nr:hypothetical protein [Bacillus sp. USDA818B3_A]
MNAMQEKLFLELRQTKEEIEDSLKKKSKQSWLTGILKAELADINTAIQKFENGNFGQCEISGELIPEDLLNMLPTMRSIKDHDELEYYYKKPLSTAFL